MTDAPASRNGHLVVIGGGEDRVDGKDVLSRFVELAGGPDKKIVVITAASAVPEKMWDIYDQAFGALGVTNRRPIHIASRAQANDAATARAVAEAVGIFMTGGDQKRLLAMIGGSELDAAKHQALATRGACIGGTSAGASAMSAHMLADGTVALQPEKGAGNLGAGARNDLSAPDVEIAILETARGGILKRGLGFDRCDVSIVLNVTADHLGLDGIETVADLARVKSVVAHAASKALVLNADDQHCLAMAKIRRKGVEVLYFSTDADNPALLRHLEHGGRAAYLQDGAVILADGTRRHALIDAALMPGSMNGHAKFNIANAPAAAAGLLADGFGTADITACLATFCVQLPQQSAAFEQVQRPGRTRDRRQCTQSRRLCCAGRNGATMAAPRIVAVPTAPGDRRDVDLREIGKTCARAFHALVVYESDGRGRALGETARIILDGAREEDAAHREHHCNLNVHDALRFGLGLCREGDLLIFTCSSSVLELVEAIRGTDPETADRIAAEA